MLKTKALLLAILLFLMTSVCVFAAEKLKIGPNLEPFKFEKPPSEEVQKYLGLPNMEPFTLSQIQGKMVIIEIMSAL